MPRYALLIEYDGAPFAGWQRQADLPTVQGAVEQALGRIAPRPITIAAAGRTDAGVHATGQVAHVDLPKPWDPFRLTAALNHHLRPAPVAVLAAALVADDWHARFSAVERRYLYSILIRRAPLARETGLHWRIGQPLDLTAMQAAAQMLVGRHDFTTFRSTMCQADSPVRTLDRLMIAARPHLGGTQVTFALSARSFLHNQVRSIVGSLERVGAGAWPPGQVAIALAARDRRACGPVAPPQGLCLTGVGYGADPFGPEKTDSNTDAIPT